MDVSAFPFTIQCAIDTISNIIALLLRGKLLHAPRTHSAQHPLVHVGFFPQTRHCMRRKEPSKAKYVISMDPIKSGRPR